MTKPRAIVSWSGGKDCALALHRVRAQLEVAALLTVFTADGSRTRSHGLRPEVIEAQAAALRLPLLKANADWSGYEARFEGALRHAKDQGITHAVFGDVFPDAHKRWAEAVASRAGLGAVEPLWGESTLGLATEFIRRGGSAMIVTVRDGTLNGDDWLGRELTLEHLDKLCDLGLDPGGENGEFHTVATRFPDGVDELRLEKGPELSHAGCRLLDLTVARATS